MNNYEKALSYNNTHKNILKHKNYDILFIYSLIFGFIINTIILSFIISNIYTHLNIIILMSCLFFINILLYFIWRKTDLNKYRFFDIEKFEILEENENEIIYINKIDNVKMIVIKNKKHK